MIKKKIIHFLNSRIGSISLIFLTFISLLILVLNNVGLTLREKIPIGETLDFSWFSDSIERMLHGYILGKDFTFTYGPLFQLVYSLPSLIFHIPSYLSVAMAPLVSFIIIFLLVLLISKFITKNFFEQIAYILFLFLILGLLSSSTDIVRVLVPMWYSLVLYDIFKKKFQWLKYGAICIIPTLIGLYSYNLFVITLIFTVIFVAIVLFKNRSNWSKNISFLLILPLIIVFQLLFSLLFTHNFNYVFNSLDSVFNYRYLIDVPWAHDRNNILFIFPVALIFLGVYLVKTKIVLAETRNLLLILILSSFVGLISALSRSDAGHILLGIYPCIITFFTVIFVISKKNRGLIAVAFVFYLLVPNKPTFYNTFAPKNILQVIYTIRGKPSFFDVYILPQNYYTENEVKDITKIIRENKDKVYIYPYDSYMLNIEGTTYNSFALGTYTYSNSLVEENTVKGLKLSPPALIILGVDTKGVLNLDDIPNFTRNPLIAKWMIENYTVSKIKSKYLVLSYTLNKKTIINQQCQAYQLSVDLAGKENFLEKLVDVVKPPVYYLGKIRLPYSPSTKSYLIFNDLFSSSGVASLFGNQEPAPAKISIENSDGNLEITRVSAFLDKKEAKIFSKNEFTLKCVSFDNKDKL